MNGTNFFTGAQGSSNVNPALVDVNGYGILVSAPSAAAVSGAGYQVGCILIETNDGVLYINTGTTSSATWTVVGSQS